MELQDELDTVDNNIGELCAERNRNKVKELLKDDENLDGGIQSKIWELKKKLVPNNLNLPPSAKKDEYGNLVTDKKTLEELYLRTYESRLQPNCLPAELDELKTLKKYLFNLRVKLAKQDVTEDWSFKQLEAALKSLKNHKARDIWGHTYELFKYGGKDLKYSLLSLFNRVKKSQTYPSIFKSSTITSIWKKKDDQTELDNDRDIFNVTKIIYMILREKMYTTQMNVEIQIVAAQSDPV